MGENVRLLQDVCCYAANHAVPTALLSLDQGKAFDRVEWPLLEKVLVQMGFGPSFRGWVSLLYTSVNSAVIVNGHLSDAFPVRGGFERGAHYPHCYTSLLPRLWPARSRQTLALIASLCHAAIAG